MTYQTALFLGAVLAGAIAGGAFGFYLEARWRELAELERRMIPPERRGFFGTLIPPGWR